jgi:tRNA A37 threonylcarbamoyladenosine dehydratase
MIIGKPALLKLGASSVALFGIGGVGGACAEALARSGVGRIALCDDDSICLTNINRQVIATHKTIGMDKVDIMAERLLEINPDIEVIKLKHFYSREIADTIDLKAYDYIIDAVDTVSAKLLLIEEAQKAGKAIISCMGTGNKLEPARLEVADIYKTSVCPLAKVMRKELRARGIKKLKVVYSKEEPITVINEDHNNCKLNCICPPDSARHCEKRRQVPGSIAFVPPVAGMIIAGEVIRDLIKQEI